MKLNNINKISETETEHSALENNSNSENNSEAASSVFEEVFGNLGDHNGFYVGPYHICDLPYIFFDDNSLQFYANKENVLSKGVYTEVEHQIVKKDTGLPPDLDLSMTNLVAYQWIAIFFVLLVFKMISRKKVLKPEKAPKGFLANGAEKVILYIRDEVVVPNFSSAEVADKLTFYFVATFIFILIVNLVGLIPGGHAATGSIPVTAALSIVAFFVINGSAIKFSGVKSWFKHLLGGAPIFLAPIMIPIEILSLFIKPFSLTIRLFANMTAGHIVLFALLGLLFYFNTYILSLAIVPFSVFIYLLELLVAFIQAFVFTMLVSIYTSQSIGEHSH